MNRDKNLFIIKRVTEDKNLSDEAFAVWCGLRNIMQKDTMEYFVSFNMIAHSLFNRVPNRYELNAIKKGYKELVDREYIKEILEYSKSEHVVDLSALYFETGHGYFCDLTEEEMHTIMSIDCGHHSNYKLLRYFTCMVGTFNKSKYMAHYENAIGGMSLDAFTELLPISKKTVINFNDILEKNQLLFIIRHKDFSRYDDSGNKLKELPNTYSRWKDQEIAQRYANDQYAYKWQQKNKPNKESKTEVANKKRALAQKIIRFQSGEKKYDIETIEQMFLYATERNGYLEKEHADMIRQGYDAEEPEENPKYINMDIFEDYIMEFSFWDAKSDESTDEDVDEDTVEPEADNVSEQEEDTPEDEDTEEPEEIVAEEKASVTTYEEYEKRRQEELEREIEEKRKTMTVDDLPDNLWTLVEDDLFTEEEAIEDYFEHYEKYRHQKTTKNRIKRDKSQSDFDLEMSWLLSL